MRSVTDELLTIQGLPELITILGCEALASGNAHVAPEAACVYHGAPKGVTIVAAV